MSPHTPAWFDDQYDNRARVPDHPLILQQWFDQSAHAREQYPDMVEAAYGDAPRERLDVFAAIRPDSPVLVYLHGGYWRALDKRDQSFIAPPYVQAGAMVVLPDYSLCPAVTIEQIVLQTVQALAWVYRHAPEHGGDVNRIVVAGHSAGGHLATMMLACDWRAVAKDLPADVVKSAVSISGIHDLDPLRNASFLANDLHLTEANVRKLSPAAMPAPKGRLLTVVGSEESEEFHRQALLIQTQWHAPTATTHLVVAGCNHMTVLQELVDTDSKLFDGVLGLLGLIRGRVSVTTLAK